MSEVQSPKERLQAWFDDPNTPQDAWKAWTLKQIETAAGVSKTSVLSYLPAIVKARHPEISGYSKFREVRQAAGQAARKTGERLSDADIQRIQTIRLTKTIHETVELTGFSPSTVQRYSGKKSRTRK